ncbi:MAG: resolvase [Microvirga sp.]|nr:resolvase [Microvirga sp.]
MRHLHPEIERGGSRSGLQLAPRPARGLRGLRHQPEARGLAVLPATYDDGGFSGGSIERPGLQKLLADIQSGVIDVVVVYKVDRLTRSLTDFAKIVEIFDRHGVSFVSVTQSFNTTTSMGRLTLNVPAAAGQLRCGMGTQES